MLLQCLLIGALLAPLAVVTPAAAGPPAQQSAAPSGVPSAAALRAACAVEPPAKVREWKAIVLHHSATTGGSVEAIDAAHRRQKDAAGEPWLGIGYHFVVGNGRSMGDGEIQSTFRWRQQLAGAHAGRRDENEHGIGICLIGNFDDAPPTDNQLAALSLLLSELSQRYSIPRERVVCHRDVQATACPGRLFPARQVLTGLPAAKGS